MTSIYVKKLTVVKLSTRKTFSLNLKSLPPQLFTVYYTIVGFLFKNIIQLLSSNVYIQTKERKFAIITKYSFCSFDFYLRSVFSCFLTIVTVSKTFAVKENFFHNEYKQRIYVYIILFLKCLSFRQLISFSHSENKTIACCVPIGSYPTRSPYLFESVVRLSLFCFGIQLTNCSEKI